MKRILEYAYVFLVVLIIILITLSAVIFIPFLTLSLTDFIYPHGEASNNLAVFAFVLLGPYIFAILIPVWSIILLRKYFARRSSYPIHINKVALAIALFGVAILLILLYSGGYKL